MTTSNGAAGGTALAERVAPRLKQRYADEHQGGWGEILDRLAALLGKRQSE